MIQTRISLLRNKFFFLIGIIISLSIFFLVFNSFQSNETTLLQKIQRLEVQNEMHNKQIEVEKGEQHQRLVAERELYERTKKELNQKMREIKEIHDKENQDASLRFSSLQQQYKILKTQHDDLEHQCEKEKRELGVENDGLKSKIFKVQGQLSKIQSAKESKDLQQKLFIDGKDKQVAPIKTIDKSFREQIPVSQDHYKIPIAIRNKLENQNVIQQPFFLNGKSSTTRKENFLTPSKVQSTSSKTSVHLKPIPKGVLPIPPELKNDNAENSKRRFDEDFKSLDDTLGKPQNVEIDENENVAHEIINDNDFNIEEKNPRSNLAGLDDFDQDKNIVNNAAEEFDAHKPQAQEKKSLHNDEMDVQIIHAQNGVVRDKLNDEIAGDHGKEPDGYPEDLHMVEGQQEEDNDLGDIGEYDDPRKHGGVAERN